MQWFKKHKVLSVILLLVLSGTLITAITSGDQTEQQAGNTNSTTQAPHFADYLNRSMVEIATEFDQTYDASNSTQINAKKNGYKLFFEDGGKTTSATKENTGKANIVAVELPSLGKCEQNKVYDKIDEAMELAHLDPAVKGDKHTDMGAGYGAYRNFKGDPALELALLCDYNGDDYHLQLRVLPELR